MCFQNRQYHCGHLQKVRVPCKRLSFTKTRLCDDLVPGVRGCSDDCERCAGPKTPTQANLSGSGEGADRPLSTCTMWPAPERAPGTGDPKHYGESLSRHPIPHREPWEAPFGLGPDDLIPHRRPPPIPTAAGPRNQSPQAYDAPPLPRPITPLLPPPVPPLPAGYRPSSSGNEGLNAPSRSASHDTAGVEARGRGQTSASRGAPPRRTPSAPSRAQVARGVESAKLLAEMFQDVESESGSDKSEESSCPEQRPFNTRGGPPVSYREPRALRDGSAGTAADQHIDLPLRPSQVPPTQSSHRRRVPRPSSQGHLPPHASSAVVDSGRSGYQESSPFVSRRDSRGVAARPSTTGEPEHFDMLISSRRPSQFTERGLPLWVATPDQAREELGKHQAPKENHHRRAHSATARTSGLRRPEAQRREQTNSAQDRRRPSTVRYLLDGVIEETEDPDRVHSRRADSITPSPPPPSSQRPHDSTRELFGNAIGHMGRELWDRIPRPGPKEDRSFVCKDSRDLERRG